MPAQAVQLPPPYKGQNDQVPTFALQSPYCERMENFHNRNGVIQLRQGNSKLSDLGSYFPYALEAYNSSMFAVCVDMSGVNNDTRFYDVTSGLFVLVHTFVTVSTIPIRALYFRGYLYFFGNGNFDPAVSGPRVYDGSAWGAAGYTWPTGFLPYGGCVHKNRAYFINYNSTSMAYSGVDLISGATTKVDLSGVITEAAKLAALCSVSLSQNVTQQSLFVAIFSNGDTLCYEGSYPDSSSWQIAARFRIPRLVYYNAYVEAKGDVFLLTVSDVLSLRNVIAQGYDAEKKAGIGAAISNRYRQFMKYLADTYGQQQQYITGTFDVDRDRLIINFPFFIDPITEDITQKMCYLIYDFTLGAWYEYTHTNSHNFNSIIKTVYFESNVYSIVGISSGAARGAYLMMLEVLGTHLDDAVTNGPASIGIDYHLKSAPHPLNRFGVVRADGLEVIMKSDIYDTIEFKLIGDLGAQETAAQLTSGNGTEITKTLVNIGIEANLIQYDISGTSEESIFGIEIHATNLWVNPSEGVAR
jgi:hypothetical protein